MCILVRYFKRGLGRRQFACPVAVVPFLVNLNIKSAPTVSTSVIKKCMVELLQAEYKAEYWQTAQQGPVLVYRPLCLPGSIYTKSLGNIAP